MSDVRRISLYTPELQLLAETVTSAATTPAIAYEYVWFAGQPVAQIESATNTRHYYFNDHLGTPVLTTNASAAIDWRVEREPFGSRHTVRVARYQPLAFPGQEDDPASDRSHNIFRWYRSGWGRYTQGDPIGIDGGLNVYAYASLSPVISIDPLGLEEGCKKKQVCDDIADQIKKVVKEMRRLIRNELDPEIRTIQISIGTSSAIGGSVVCGMCLTVRSGRCCRSCRRYRWARQGRYP